MTQTNKVETSNSVFSEYDIFDVANGLYHWLQHNWQGMDDLYEAFCELTAPGAYRPSRSEESYDNASEEALSVYNELTLDNYREVLDLVLNYESEEKAGEF